MTGYVTNFFSLSDSAKLYLKNLDSPFPTAVGEIVYYRTYSRKKKDGSQEHWADTVIRVTEGILSVRKDYYLKHNLGWDDEKWQEKWKEGNRIKIDREGIDINVTDDVDSVRVQLNRNGIKVKSN